MALFFLSNLAAAHSDEAAQQFQSGRSAFEQADYAAALAAFEAAVAAGMSGPAVHFNIGVAAYRSGRYDRATVAFRETARTPQMAALAHYNLGLVALRLDDSSGAMRWFSRAEREATDERLRSLASAQLEQLFAQLPQRNWIGYAAFAVGYDDNVALISNSDVLGVSDTKDSFAELQLAFSAPLDGPWRFDAGLSALDNQEVDSFDQLSVNGGGRYRLSTGEWTNEIGAQLAYTTLDGETLDTKRMLLLQTRNSMRAGRQLRAHYRFSDIDGHDEFSGLSGRRHEAGVRTGWIREPWELGFAYRFDVDDYVDAALSATHHQLSLDLQRTLPGEWAMAVETVWRNTRYDVGSNSQENRAELIVTASRALSARWRLMIRYSHADNRADSDEFDYRRNRIAIGVEAAM